MKHIILSGITLAFLLIATRCQSQNSVVEKNPKSTHPPFSEVEKLHGHVCPGSAMGYRMACVGMDRIKKMGIGPKELMAIVENNKCGTDSLQCVTGCTFGKGKILFDDYGKSVYTLFSSKTRKGVRIVFLRDKIPENVLKDRKIFTKWVLEAPEDAILKVSEVTVDRPLPKRTKESVKCPICGESVNKTKMRELKGQKVCIPCAKNSK